MNATQEIPQQINEVSPKIIKSLVNSGVSGANQAGTRPKIDAWLTHWCSLPVQDGWRVYFIRGGDFIKIGFSTDPIGRLASLRTACPFELALLADIPGSKDDEQQIHRMFADLHVRGEWFRDDPRILTFIKQTRAKRRTRPSGPKPNRSQKEK